MPTFPAGTNREREDVPFEPFSRSNRDATCNHHAGCPHKRLNGRKSRTAK